MAMAMISEGGRRCGSFGGVPSAIALSVTLMMMIAFDLVGGSNALTIGSDPAVQAHGGAIHHLHNTEMNWQDRRSLKLEWIEKALNQSTFVLGSGNNTFQGYTIRPSSGRIKAVILLLTDVFGLPSNNTRALAARLAASSQYAVVVPDLFRGDPFGAEAAIATPGLLAAWLAAHPDSVAAADISTTISYIVQTFEQGTPIGVMGFCYGGGKVFRTLESDGGKIIKAGVAFYGTAVNVSESVKIKSPLLMIAGGNDSFVPADKFYEMKSLMNSLPSPTPVEVIVFPNMPHGFAHNVKPETRKAARKAFRAMRRWFKKYLKA